MLQRRRLGLVVVKLAALQRQRLAVIGNGLVAIAFQLVGAAAIGIGAGKLRVEAQGPVEIGERGIELALVHVDPGAGMQRIRLVLEQQYRTLGVVERLVELTLLRIAPGAAV